MTTIGANFRTKASEIITKFATENGLSTYYDVTSRAYTTETGVVVDTLTSQTLYIAFDDIALELFKTGNPAAFDPEYLKDHMVALIAGDDITVTPKENGLITPAGGTGKHRITNVATDMYKAMYTCYITRKPV